MKSFAVLLLFASLICLYATVDGLSPERVPSDQLGKVVLFNSENEDSEIIIPSCYFRNWNVRLTAILQLDRESALFFFLLWLNIFPTEQNFVLGTISPSLLSTLTSHPRTVGLRWWQLKKMRYKSWFNNLLWAGEYFSLQKHIFLDMGTPESYKKVSWHDHEG